MATNSKSTFRDNVVRIIAVLGLIAVLLLGAWGIIQLAFWLPSFFSNIPGSISRMFGGSSAPTAIETLAVSLPATVKSGEEFTITWKHNNKEDANYSYALSYACADGVSLQAPLPTGTYQDVACNTPFNFTNADANTKLVAKVGSKAASTTITVAANKLDSGVVTATATGGTMVTPTTATQTTQKPVATQKPAAQYIPSGRTQNLWGSPDLSVRIITNPGTVRAGSRIALQFVVENVGTNVASQGWSFTASLPYNPVFTYPSGPQQALYPGDKIVYTLGYDAVSNYDYTYQNQPCTFTYPQTPGCTNYGSQYYPGTYNYPATASLAVDPNNYVWEQNENNNFASVTYTVY